MPEIKTKTEMMRRWNRGEFGNKLRTWNTAEEWRAANPKVAIKDWPELAWRDRRPGGPLISCPGRIEISMFETHVLCDVFPHHEQTIQGEFMDLVGSGPHLYCTYLRERMKTALQSPWRWGEYNGVLALEVLKYRMDHSSYENLLELRNEYPNHVVEFSCCQHTLGELQWNTVFWDVRNY